MDASQTEPMGSILDWDEAGVHSFFVNLGCPQFEAPIRDNSITGEVLIMMNVEHLIELGVTSIGRRLAILKGVYLAKVAQGLPIGEDDYVPPSELAERHESLGVDKMQEVLKSHAQRLLQIEEENRTLRGTLQSALDDLNRRIVAGDESPQNKHTTFKWVNLIKPGRSPTKPDTTIESPQPSPRHLENLDGIRPPTLPDYQPPPTAIPPVLANSTNLPSGESNGAAPPKPTRQESTDNLKSFKVSLEDPAWKVLPAALKKYKINNDDWQNYAMFICYGSTGNRVERCLSYDEKPLLLFQKLKDAKKNPVFMLKHIKDIRSPIAVAQQKHAARKASIIGEPAPPNSSVSHLSASSTLSGSTAVGTASARSSAVTEPSRAGLRPPRLNVTHDGVAAGAPGPMTGTAMQPGWPDLMSPAVDNRERAEPGASGDALGAAGDAYASKAAGGPAAGALNGTDPEPLGVAPSAAREMPPASAQGLSYAVAIYPYMAEQEDEFDVVVGDTFVILSRARGWWVVQRDPVGTGQIEADTSKQGWVPAGCLLETKLPVASAIAEANAKGTPTLGSESPTSPISPTTATVNGSQRKMPILPLSIVSTSFPGIALMDYPGKGEEELDLMKDDSLRVFKRYNHWSYAVKEDTGDRGWVPSWYIGKIAPTVATSDFRSDARLAGSGTPGTPNTIGPPSSLNASISSVLDTDGSSTNQPSPMSSAFPVVGKASAVAS